MTYSDISDRRGSEGCEKGLDEIKTSNLDKNRSQIFTKGPSLTRELLEKMHHAELGSGRIRIFGQEFRNRQFWLLTGLLVLFCLSFIGTILMWFTNVFDNAVYSNLALVNNTPSFEMWQRPSPRPLYKIHVFNYTNIQAYKDGIDAKLNVEDVGPYVYEESLERVNVVFNEDSTVSYQEKRTFKFRPDLSKGKRQSDRLTVPNIPLLAGAANSHHATFFERMAFSGLLKGFSSEPFIELPAQRFIFGYEDNLYDVSKSILRLRNEKPTDNFGLLVRKLGIQPDVITVDTGVENINEVGMIKKVNDQTDIGHWSTEDCNSFKGTDGSTFPPRLIRNKKEVYFYNKDMCRALPMRFDRESTVLDGKVPSYLYKLREDIFDTPDIVLENQCFCNLNSGECPLQGTFNTTPCVFGAPFYLSFPHFHRADPRLVEGVTGLKPNETEHETFVHLHPNMGFAMSGKTRFQGNIKMIKSFGISELDMFHEDELMLPISWLEFALEEESLPEDMVSIIFQATFTVRDIELGLKYGCLLQMVVTLICIVIIIKNRWQTRERTSSLRPLQRNVV